MITNKKTAFLLQKTPLLQSNLRGFQAVLPAYLSCPALVALLTYGRLAIT